jgi:hypothetical protein
VNDVGPMISEQVIARCEILRPDSALIPSNEAEKPRYTHTHTHCTQHTLRTHCTHACPPQCLPVSLCRHCSVGGGGERARAGLLGTMIDQALFLHPGGCSSARRLPGRAGAEGGLTMGRKSLHGCSKSGSRVRAGAGAGWGGDELRRGRGQAHVLGSVCWCLVCVSAVYRKGTGSSHLRDQPVCGNIADSGPHTHDYGSVLYCCICSSVRCDEYSILWRLV